MGNCENCKKIPQKEIKYDEYVSNLEMIRNTNRVTEDREIFSLLVEDPRVMDINHNMDDILLLRNGLFEESKYQSFF